MIYTYARKRLGVLEAFVIKICANVHVCVSMYVSFSARKGIMYPYICMYTSI